MNQERIFRFVGSAGLGGGFAAGAALPKEKGVLKDFKIVRLTAIKDENSNQFIARLIEKLGEKPKATGESRGRQLDALLEKATCKGKMFITIINKAHLLHIRTLYSLKGIHELGDFERPYPGFVLLGEIVKIHDLLKKKKGILLRTIILPS